jgi:WD40 repeat protein/serine/threonine protein kinase
MLQERIAQVVKGYELHEQIGGGGYGVVYRAYQPLVGRDVAVKIILPQYANQPDFIRRFEWEAQLVARLEHPYIVPLYDYWRDPGGAFLVMRWLRGGDLHDLLNNRPLPAELLGQLIDQVGGALASAHRRGVVHRDLKPANILLDEEGNAYLADFGIAKDLGTHVSPFQTDVSKVVGSPAYISPEQVRGEPITPQTDIYSLGVMLYEILTGQLPFDAPTPIALMFKHVQQPLPTVRAHRPDLSDAVNIVIQKATAKSPADRYADVSTLIRELRLALASGPAVTARLADAQPAPSQPANDNRTTSGTPTRSKYETGVLYLPVPLAEPIEAAIENPYKGLRAFQEADADDFFGRDLLIRLLLARIQEQVPLGRFLAVVGPSGSGKSSVVRAGLVPAIRRGALPGSQNWFVVEMFPGARPIEELAQALMRIAVEPPNNLIELLMLDDQGLLRVVDQVVPGADEIEMVLVIDQFEEVFTLVEDETARTHFLNSLMKAVTDPYSRIRVIVTLRADFYDRPLLYPGFSELMRQRTEVVVPLASEELKQAIVNPAERNGLHVDPELVDAIINDVAEQPGALPLLQYALTEVFERRSGRALTLTPYHVSGGVRGALARRAEEIYTGLRAEQQEAARQLFLRLVTLGEGVEDTRRRVHRTELAFINHREHIANGTETTSSAPAIAEKVTLDQVIDIYGQYRLLTSDNDPATRAPTVEIAHEALIRTWTRLRSWLDASRDDLRLQRRMTMAAAEWVASGQDRSFLASGARLEQLAGWADETHLALNAEERDYLRASLAERDAQRAQEEARSAHEIILERRSRIFLQALLGVASLAAVVGILLSIYAFGQRRTALNNAQLAELSANNALRAQQLAQSEANRANQNTALAQELALTQGAQAAFDEGNMELARTLASAAVVQPDHRPLAEKVLAQAVYNPGSHMILQGHNGVVTSVAYSPDQTMALSGGGNNQGAILWDLKTGTKIKRFFGHERGIRRVAFLPDGRQILTGSNDGTIRLWDIRCATPSAQECNTPTRVFVDHLGFEVRSITLRPNRNQFLATSSDKSLKLWDINCITPTPQRCETPVRVFQPGNGGHTLEVNDVAFTSDGKRALSTSEDTTLVLWDVETGAPLKRLEDPNGAEVRTVAILPGDKEVLSSGARPDIIRWDLETGQVIDRLRGHKGTTFYLQASADGTRAISGSADNTVIVWDLEKNVPLTVLRGHGGPVRQVVFSKDESQALSASADAEIRLWDLNHGAEQLQLSVGGTVNDINLSLDGRLIATATGGGAAQVWDTTSGQIAMPEFRWHGRAVKALAISPDGRYLVTGGDKRDGALILTDLRTQQIVNGHFKFTAFGYHSIAFTPDGKRVVTGQVLPGDDDFLDDKTLDPKLRNISLIVWDMASGEPIYKATDIMANQKQHASIDSLAITPDGKQIVAATSTGTNILILDLDSGTQVSTLELGNDWKVNQIALTADGKRLIAGTTGNVFIVWDITTGKRLFTSPPEAGAVTAVALTNDGRYAASASGTDVFLWDMQTEQKIRTFTGHRLEVKDLLFTNDRRTVISASQDKTVRFWRIETVPEIIAWAQTHRTIPKLTCDQEKLYNLPPAHCI